MYWNYLTVITLLPLWPKVHGGFKLELKIATFDEDISSIFLQMLSKHFLFGKYAQMTYNGGEINFSYDSHLKDHP